jgi:hypothetical protein
MNNQAKIKLEKIKKLKLPAIFNNTTMVSSKVKLTIADRFKCLFALISLPIFTSFYSINGTLSMPEKQI